VNIIAKHINIWIKDSIKKKLSRKLAKCSYIILGNLSNNIQTKIEKKWKNYNAEEASWNSFITNLGLYSITAGVISYQLLTQNVTEGNVSDIVATSVRYGSVIGFVSGSIEALVRANFADPLTREKPYTASLPGKLISTPYDIICYVHEKKKNSLLEKKVLGDYNS